ncbi:MAG TPA: hypothetical protein VLX92_02290 [Kofleriaceae bacterium]|nr:hypothetical protein [Kofleriaceae bacterium]
MRWLILVLAAAACGAGDDTTDGARANCAEGGAENACPAPAHDAESVCWYMVDCAAIPLSSNNNGVFDWASCVNYIEQLTDDRQRLVIDCIAASSCDQLKVNNSPGQPNAGDFQCLQIGDQ